MSVLKDLKARRDVIIECPGCGESFPASQADLFSDLQEMQRIHGICPCCEEVFRLSDARLYVKRSPPRTDFDRVRDAQEALDRAQERIEAREEAIREAQREQGRREARRRLRRIAPRFVRNGLEAGDVKVLFDPVEYVVFPGLTARPPRSSDQERLQRSLGRAIRSGNLEWSTYRVGEDGRVNRE